MSKPEVEIDELEALLAGLDEDIEAIAVAETTPEVEAPKAAEPVEEIELDEADLAALEEQPVVEKVTAEELAVEELVPETPQEAVIEARKITEEEQAEELKLVEEGVGEPEIDEVEALLAEVEASAPQTKPAEPEPKREDALDHFTPESDLRTFIDPDQLKEDLAFTQSNISLAMTRQASLFAHYSMLAHRAQFQADRADQQVDLVEAQLDQKYRDAFATAGTKATENMIKSAIIKDGKYQKAVMRKHEAKAIAEMVKSAADSFRHRRDMLIQVGADLRAEAQGGVRTKEHPGAGALAAMSRTA